MARRSLALVRSDFKGLSSGYSSVSHMGLVLLGLLTLTQIGIDGAVLLDVSPWNSRRLAFR